LTLSTRVYTKLLQVPEGKVTTYGDLAKAVGLENSQRVIGTIMKKSISWYSTMLQSGKI